MEFKKIEHMLSLQDQVNSLISKSWRENNNPWYRAIWLESAELLEHLSWKWWSNSKNNIEQAQLELIDIWHFGLSDLLQKHGTSEKVIAFLKKTYVSYDLKMENETDISLSIEAFALSTLKNKSFDISLFFNLCKILNLEFNELYKIYVGKNVLNEFRQKNGYKTGEYKKIWNNHEDNYYLFKIIKELDINKNEFCNQVYEKLENQYQESFK
ncbi:MULTISPECIES: dUTP diphosphatase [Acinetobacter]|uniref:dUTP diphosphatase n=1 Tax=Acinetobacter TaxID=469 RepID=UPI00208EB690|nr:MULTISPECIES: dUTP diphosphatase [Acinetobacter]MDO6644333.1 dUTP diphosphatase [Acinetobacter guillouiae]